ncbi:RDD family protein [Planctomonas psychrotolerans]|uniref:RDD family protein n=1 Tax=Planctomonas psychrotolerans TaxID=2528712 RepID=UPI001D0D4AAA|nr:RDD family protein [Planctomonas psychrotolerans]
MPNASPSPPPHGDPAANLWPGHRLGLPREGPGSIARPGRRIAAISIDFALCALITYAFFFGADFASLGIFAIEQVVFLATLGASIGHLTLGLRLITITGEHCGLWRPILRTALLCLLLPALVWNADQRGLHDVFSGTVLVRR